MIPWTNIRDEYVRGMKSREALAEKWSVSPTTLARRAEKEHWDEMRAEYCRQWLIGRSENPCGEYFLEGVRDAAETLTETIRRALQNPEQVYGSCSKEDKADVTELTKWTAMLKELSALMRSLYDAPTLPERVNLRLQEKKLGLEEKKLAAPENSGDARVFLPREEWDKEGKE